MTMGTWEEESCWYPEHQDQTQTDKQLLPHFSVTEPDQEQVLVKGFQTNVVLNDTENPYKESPKLNGGTKHVYPIRSYAEDCPFYLRTGYCKFGSYCKFNHPVRTGFQEKERGGFVEQPVQIQCKFYRTTAGCRHGEACRFIHSIENSEIPPSELNAFGLPIKLGKENKSDGFVEQTGQIECKHYLSAGGCKYGKTCKYSHLKEKSSTYIKKPETAPLELNFLGLPIRVLEKECPFYMRNGSCAYGVNCKFHHPDPVAAGGSDSTPTGVSLRGHSSGNYDPLQLIKDSEPALELCSSTILSQNPVPHVNILSYHAHGMHPNSNWSRPQGSMYPCARTTFTHPVPANNNLMNTANVSRYQQEVEEFPERPGQPECNYFMKTGSCKYRSSCKFHHPKSRASKSSVCTL